MQAFQSQSQCPKNGKCSFCNSVLLCLEGREFENNFVFIFRRNNTLDLAQRTF